MTFAALPTRSGVCFSSPWSRSAVLTDFGQQDSVKVKECQSQALASESLEYLHLLAWVPPSLWEQSQARLPQRDAHMEESHPMAHRPPSMGEIPAKISRAAWMGRSWRRCTREQAETSPAAQLTRRLVSREKCLLFEATKLKERILCYRAKLTRSASQCTVTAYTVSAT